MAANSRAITAYFEATAGKAREEENIGSELKYWTETITDERLDSGTDVLGQRTVMREVCEPDHENEGVSTIIAPAGLHTITPVDTIQRAQGAGEQKTNNDFKIRGGGKICTTQGIVNTDMYVRVGSSFRSCCTQHLTRGEPEGIAWLTPVRG